MRNFLIGSALAVAAVALPANSVAGPRASVPARRSVVPVAREELGLASWYGDEFQGSATTSGELFDSKSLTAAHRTLPLGSWIRVTNLRNHKSVILKVNDRGPNVQGRLVDVSRAGAERLGFRAAGIARVSVRPVSYPRGYSAQAIDPSALYPGVCRRARSAAHAPGRAPGARAQVRPTSKPGPLL
jgi:peptidoglycan lytic transglycosylase